MESPLYEIFWGCYWVLVLLTIIISFVALFKKYFKTGIPAVLLSLVMPIFSFVFALSRDWASTQEDELAFLVKELKAGSWQAYIIIIANIILVILTIYHIYKFLQKKK